MKTINLIISIAFVWGSINGQSINKRVECINKKLSTYTCYDFTENQEARLLKAIVDNSKTLTRSLILKKTYTQISLDENGILTIKKISEEWEVPKGIKFPDWLNYPAKYNGKTVLDSELTVNINHFKSEIKTSKSPQYIKGAKNRIIILECSDYAECVKTIDSDWINPYEITFCATSPKEARKLKKTFKSLISKSKLNKSISPDSF